MLFSFFSFLIKYLFFHLPFSIWTYCTVCESVTFQRTPYSASCSIWVFLNCPWKFSIDCVLRDSECPNKAVYLGFVAQADGNMAMLCQKRFQNEKPCSEPGVCLLELEQISHSQLMFYWWPKGKEGWKKAQTWKHKLIQCGIEASFLKLLFD